MDENAYEAPQTSGNDTGRVRLGNVVLVGGLLMFLAASLIFRPALEIVVLVGVGLLWWLALSLQRRSK